jgi:hypothetical protein
LIFVCARYIALPWFLPLPPPRHWSYAP